MTRLAVRRGMLVLAVLAALLMVAESAWAQEAAPSDWQQGSLQDPVQQLFTPRTGAFFAQTRAGLYRSDDAGQTWRSLSLPPTEGWREGGVATGERRTGQVAVDPSDQQTLYAIGTGGLYKSSDGAQTWQLTRASAAHLLSVAVSPADPRLLYVVAQDGQLSRSGDAGVTWQDVPGTVYPDNFSGGVYSCYEVRASPFVPDPTVANRLIFAIQCLHGTRTLVSPDSGKIEQSPDQGLTRLPFFRPTTGGLVPGRLVGGNGTAPSRFYLSMDRPNPSGFASAQGSSSLFRTDDVGSSWTELTGLWDEVSDPSGPPLWTKIGGLAYDPANPDSLYVGLTRFALGTAPNGSPTSVPVRGWVRATTDGGLSWNDLGCTDLGEIQDLALGIDGLNLYAGTLGGVWRLPLVSADVSAAPVACPSSAP